MKFTRLVIGAFALLLPPVMASPEYIEIDPPAIDEMAPVWEHIYDYGDVELESKLLQEL